VRALVVIVLAGCDFNPREQASIDAEVVVDAAPDAASDASSVRDCLAHWRAGTVTLGTPAPLANVNTPEEDRDPHLSADEHRLYFSSRRNGSQNSDIYLATRVTSDADFSTAQRQIPTSSPDDDDKLAVSPDDLTAYLSSNRPGTLGNADIFVATRESTSAPFAVFGQVGAVNGPDPERDPDISSDGNTLYLAVDIPHQVIAVATRNTITNLFDTPVPIIDSGDGDGDPSVSADELVILFTSNRAADALSGTNLWYMTRADTSSAFANPRLVPAVNGNTNDGDPSLSRDGCRVYFASDRGVVGSYDLFVADVTN
jgi:Tol biopolymer transport system component